MRQDSFDTGVGNQTKTRWLLGKLLGNMFLIISRASQSI